jgi:uncharacterized protein (TIRG00374 family)
MEKGRRVKVAVSIALAAALLAFFLSKANLRDVGARIAHVAPGAFLLSLACALSAIPLRAWRWQVLLRPVGRVPFGASFAATSIGFAASTVLPARAGEVVRPVVLAGRTRVPLSACFASVLFERVIDLTTVLLFFLFYGLWPGLRPSFSGRAATVFASLRALAIASGAAALVFYAVALIATGRRHGAQTVVERMIGWLPERLRARAAGAFSSFLDGMQSVRHPRTLAATAFLSVALWAIVCGQVYFLFRAFRLPLGPAASILIVVATLIGLAIPTPGGVGGFHKLCQVALTLFYGIDVDAATGLAIVYWFVAFTPVTLIGFWLFAAGPGRRESLADLAEAAAAESSGSGARGIEID